MPQLTQKIYSVTMDARLLQLVMRGLGKLPLEESLLGVQEIEAQVIAQNEPVEEPVKKPTDEPEKKDKK